MAAAAAVTGRLTDVRKLVDPGSEEPPSAKKQKIDPAVEQSKSSSAAPAVTDEASVEEMTDIQPQSSAAPKASAPAEGIAKFTVLKGHAAPLDKSFVTLLSDLLSC